MLEIVIPSLPPAEFSPNARVHWAVRGKAANQAYDEVIIALHQQGWNAPPIKAALISVSWGVKDRRKRDTDNFVARTKPYIDQLVKSGVLADDDRFHVRYQYGWHESKTPETVINIEVDSFEED